MDQIEALNAVQSSKTPALRRGEFNETCEDWIAQHDTALDAVPSGV